MPRFTPPPPRRRDAPSPTPEPETERGAPASTIGDLARDFGLTLRALRFYESRGMLQPQRRGLTRLYTAADRERLATILDGKQLGLSLREIRERLARDADGPALRLSEAEVAQRIAALEAQKHEIERAIAGLRDLRGGPAPTRRRSAA